MAIKRRGKRGPVGRKKPSKRGKAPVKRSNRRRGKPHVVKRTKKSRQPASRKKVSAKGSRRSPSKKSAVQLKRELERSRKEIKRLKNQLRRERIARRLKLLKQRAKRKRQIPRMIEALTALGEYERRRAINEILSSADSSEEYWELVYNIADELDLSTYFVLVMASPPKGAVGSW